MSPHHLVTDAAPDWVSQLANEHGLGLVPWSRLVCQALQLALEASQAELALFAVADKQGEHLLIWPQLQFLSVKGHSDLTAEAATARGGFLYRREEMQLSLHAQPFIASQPEIDWCAGRALPAAASGLRLGNLILLGRGTPPSAPAVQERLRAAASLLAAALTGRTAGDGSGPDLMSRRDFDRQLSRETRRSERSGQPLGILLASLPTRSRKQSASDGEVQRLGEAIARLLRRGGDYTARYGSQSIAILLPDSDAAATAGTAGMLNAALVPLLAEYNATRSSPLALKLATTSVKGFALDPAGSSPRRRTTALD